ncbi:MAG TPA: hypothetical protein VI363_01850 [Burkholderiales bacterium]
MSTAQVLKTLRNARGFPALKKAVLAMCGPSGPVTSYTLIFHSSGHSVSCLLEMRWPLLDSEAREFGAFGFGNTVCLEIDAGPERPLRNRAES